MSSVAKVSCGVCNGSGEDSFEGAKGDRERLCEGLHKRVDAWILISFPKLN